MKFPEPRRISLAHLPTPIEPLDRLASHLGRPAGSLLVKRDDATGLASGGNKTRKLEYLCADAQGRGADTLVTGGGAQSNHARQTAAAAARLGMRCVLVLRGPQPPTEGNLVLDGLLGAEIAWAAQTGGHDALENAIRLAAERVQAEGGRPYRIPLGGASTVGTYGYVVAARELVEQAGPVDLVVCADGTGGTHAGLSAGLGDHGRVLGVDVGARDDLATAVARLAEEVAGISGVPPPTGEPQIDRDHVGDGYAIPSEAGLAAVRLVAQLEGLVLDPVYTGKAMAALLARMRDGRIAPGDRVVFVHTGGLPAVFTSEFASTL